MEIYLPPILMLMFFVTYLIYNNYLLKKARLDTQHAPLGNLNTAKRNSKFIQENLDNDKVDKSFFEHIMFHMIAKEEIEIAYASITKESRVKSVTTKRLKKDKQHLGLNIEVLKGGIDDSTDLEVTTTVEPYVASLSEKYQTYLKYQKSNKDVILGLENIYIEQGALEHFDGLIESLDKHYGFHLDNACVSEKQDELKSIAAQEKREIITQASKQILIESTHFFVEKADRNGTEVFSFTFHHPLSEVLMKEDIYLIIETSEISPKFKSDVYHSNLNEPILLNIYGRILRNTESDIYNSDDSLVKRREIYIYPWAIY
jgi:hypothetical protein